jgi:broad specificity phosphatase PhoE
LDADGLQQARCLPRAFEGIHLDRIVSSDLSRSLDTANAFADGRAVELSPLLRERGFGEWEGTSFEGINAQVLALASQGHDPFHTRPPQGESFHDVWQRLESVVEDINHYNGNIAIVSHGGTCALLLAKLLRGTLETSRAFRFSNTGVTELQRRPDGLFLMLRYNDTAHLRQGALVGDMDGSRQ